MISTLFATTSVIVILVAFVLVVASLVRRYTKLRGPRVVTCPADNTHAGVAVDALRGTLSRFSARDLRLESCSHWPERKNCGQECLQQIEDSPDGCLVRNILAAWYANKSCVICGQRFERIDWLEHRPGLVSADRVTKGWSQIRAQDLYEKLTSHFPVCWNCHIAATFRRQYPELVTDRPWKRS